MRIGKPIYHNLACHVRRLNSSLDVIDKVCLNIWNSKTHIWDSVSESVRLNTNDDEVR